MLRTPSLVPVCAKRVSGWRVGSANLDEDDEENRHRDGLDQDKPHEHLRVGPFQVAATMVMEGETNLMKLPR